MTRLLFDGGARGKKRIEIERLCRAPGIEAVATGSVGELEQRCRESAAMGLKRVIVAGGDGTLHHAIRGLQGTACALGVVPLGTGNDLARALGLLERPQAAFERARRGTPRAIDLGTVDGVPFACVAGLGIDGEVNRRVARCTGPLRGPWIYPLAAIRTVLDFVPLRVEIEHDDGVFRGAAVLAAAANTACYGGGMRIAPEARVDDGALDLIVVEAVSRMALLALLPRVYSGGHVNHPAVHTFRTRRAHIRADRSLTFFADGEPVLEACSGGNVIEILPRSLRVVT